MLVDARRIPTGEALEADVCVAGAGPAGLATALELEAAGATVVLLERGGEPLPGEVEGTYPPLESMRAGGIGGSAALWAAELAPGSFGARYAPLAPIDFEEREDVPWSGWPFRRAELDPWYERAHHLCDAGPYDYDPAAAAGRLGLDGRLAGGVFRFGLGEVFTRGHRERVRESSTVRVLDGATALGVETEGGAVKGLRAASEPGRELLVRAHAYVLALGGIENARFLLLSRLGGEHDLVGRFLMDHPTVRCRLELDDVGADGLAPYDVRDVEGRPVLGALGLPEETMRREALLNGGFFVVPALDRELRALESAKALTAAVRRGRLPEEPVRELRNLAGGLDTLALAAHRRLARSVPALRPTLRLSRRAGLLNTLGVGHVSGWSRLRGRGREFDLHHVVEQAPEPERRVVLGSGRDRFGRPVARVRFFVSERELASLDRAEELAAAELERAGVGRLRTARELAPGGDVVAALHPSAHHHLGTTRMHADPRRGVVDPDGRVHGLRNLYVTGGSVFPTSGFVNPTLTIVALAARLAAHLREEALG
jgi:choline dehydrogenase-like flavoprotein